jgi:hypothetical protein
MKRERLTPRDIAVLASVFVLVVCCVCGGLALATLEDVGQFITAPFRWFGELFGSSDPGLDSALNSRSPSTFRVGSGCSFSYTDGSLVDSRRAGDAFASSLSRQEVIEYVLDFLNQEDFVVRDGAITLRSGEPVTISRYGPGHYYLSLLDEQRAGDAIETTRVEGVVQENIWTGSYYTSQTLSTVVDGQGIEQALTIQAEFACPLQWIEN